MEGSVNTIGVDDGPIVGTEEGVSVLSVLNDIVGSGWGVFVRIDVGIAL